MKSKLSTKFVRFSVLLGSLAIVGAGAGTIYFVIQNDPEAIQFKRRDIAAVPEKQVPQEVSAYTYTYDLKNISIPLATRDASRIAYAQFTLRLDLPSDDAKKSMEMNRAQVLNSVYDVASQFYVEDFKDPVGYKRFKIALRKNLSGQFRAHSPRHLAIENWVLH